MRSRVRQSTHGRRARGTRTGLRGCGVCRRRRARDRPVLPVVAALHGWRSIARRRTGCCASWPTCRNADGRFVNFIFDWTGRRNRAGRTSQPGADRGRRAPCTPWRVPPRFSAMPNGTSVSNSRRRLAGRADSVPGCARRGRPGGARILEGNPVIRARPKRAIAWSAEIAAHSSEGRLLNASGALPIHLWGHLQERALAEQAPPSVDRSWWTSPVRVPSPYSCPRSSVPSALTTCCLSMSLPIVDLDAVADATGEDRYAAAAMRGRDWFHGRNTAGQAVYDVERGLVFDG